LHLYSLLSLYLAGDASAVVNSSPNQPQSFAVPYGVKFGGFELHRIHRLKVSSKVLSFVQSSPRCWIRTAQATTAIAGDDLLTDRLDKLGNM
jgi:hypothetical protein